MTSNKADDPSITEGRQYHIQCKKGDLANYLLIPGNPERIPKIVESWEPSREIAYHREFYSFTGKYKGTDISAISSGIGPACMAIVVHEATAVGVDTFIRVGSTGAIGQGIECGDLVISSAAVRLDGASQSYVFPEYPAHANYEVLLALIEAAEGLDVRYHVGITATTADFYAGQERPSPHAPHPSSKHFFIRDLQKANVLNFEMECATLFTLSNLFNNRAGTVCAVYANRIKNVFNPGAGEEDCIKVANEAVSILREWDTCKQANGKKHFYPSLLK
jgi:uridine phosphorylase